MNTHTFQQRVKRIVLAAGKYFLIITAFLSAAAFAQSAPEVDVSAGLLTLPSSLAGGTGEGVFYLFIGVRAEQSRATATGVTARIELPEGAEPVGLNTTNGACNFADSVITCDLGELSSGSIDQAATIVFKIKAAPAARSLTVTAKVAANETDPKLENNTSISTVLVRKAREKKTRFF